MFTSLAATPKNFDIVEFSKFSDHIPTDRPPLVFRGTDQTERIQELLSGIDYNCKSIIVENKYIDRAYTDEYRDFYGSSFTSFHNYCKRLHFFSLNEKQLKKEIDVAMRQINQNPREKDLYYSLCRKLSESYLGFIVVKPLPNTRIGRTIIRHPKSNDTLKFPCTKQYKTHLFGLELSICGLPFQQQDGGMSACASTATWASLNQVTEFEEFTPPSPASITKLATKQILPFGRPIPQDNGLTVAQMCQAVEATGLSSYLVSLKSLQLDKRKSLIYSSVKSGFAPILIIQHQGRNIAHAVTVSGMVVDKPHNFASFTNIKIAEIGWSLSGLYINDDRICPYHCAQLDEGPNGLNLIIDKNTKDECWELTHILIPLHNKIRFALVGLQEASVKIADQIVGSFAYKWESETGQSPNCDKLLLETWIYKSQSFQRNLLFGNSRISDSASRILYDHLSLPRYVGIIRLEDESFGVIHILVDSTNTTTHANYLFVLGRNIKTVFGMDLVKVLALELNCPYLID